MESAHQLSDLQIAIMRVIWSRGEATVAEVQNALQRERGLANTTIATVLSRLEKRGFLAHRSHGRQYVYRALLTEPEVRRGMVAEFMERLFQGDVTELVSSLLGSREMSTGDLERVRALILSWEREQSTPLDGEERTADER
jgi:predicted transcriptional regulator